MKMRKTLVCLLVIVAVAALSAVFIIAYGNKETGTDYESDDMIITRKQLDNCKAVYALEGVSVSDDEVIKKIVTDRLLYKEAVKAGVTLTDDEVWHYMNETKETMKKDPEVYKFYLSYLKDTGMTEDEYWEKSFPVYKRAYTTGKYRKYLKGKFAADHPDISATDLHKAFDEYYDKYTDDLYEEYTRKYGNVSITEK